MRITPIKPLQRPKKSVPPSSHIMEVTVVAHPPHAHTGGDPRQMRSHVFKHQISMPPLAQPTAMNVPSGLMARAVGRPFAGTGNL